MKKSVMIAVILLLLFLVSCGKSNIQAAVVGTKMTPESQIEKQQPETQTENLNSKTAQDQTSISSEENQKTAKEMLEELKDSTKIKQEVKTGTFYGNIKTNSTGKDALKEKTKALFEKEFFKLNVDADRQQGPRYH